MVLCALFDYKFCLTASSVNIDFKYLKEEPVMNYWHMTKFEYVSIISLLLYYIILFVFEYLKIMQSITLIIKAVLAVTCVAVVLNNVSCIALLHFYEYFFCV